MNTHTKIGVPEGCNTDGLPLLSASHSSSRMPFSLQIWRISIPLRSLHLWQTWGKQAMRLLLREKMVQFSHSQCWMSVISVWQGKCSSFQLALYSFRFPNTERIPVCLSVAAAFHGLLSQLDQVPEMLVGFQGEPGGSAGQIMCSSCFCPGKLLFHPEITSIQLPTLLLPRQKNWESAENCRGVACTKKRKLKVKPGFFLLSFLFLCSLQTISGQNKKKMKTKPNAFWLNFALSVSFIAQGREVCG